MIHPKMLEAIGPDREGTEMTNRTIKCGICGDPYKVYAFTTADQSACPQCVRKAEEKVEKVHRGVESRHPWRAS